MSTKINTGFVLNEGVDLMHFVRKMSKTFDAIRDTLDSNVLAVTLGKRIDKIDLAGEKRGRVMSHMAYAEIQYDRKKEDKRSVFSDPHYCDVYFYHNAATNRIYGTLHAMHERDYYGALLDFDEVSDFHYQNSTDKSADVSIEEWEARRELWDTLIKTSALKYSVREEYDIREAALAIEDNLPSLLSDIPPKQNRAAHYTMNDLSSAVFKSMTDQSNYFYYVGTVLSFIRDNPANDLVELTASMLTELTVDDLSGKIVGPIHSVEALEEFKAKKDELCAAWLDKNKEALAKEGIPF